MAGLYARYIPSKAASSAREAPTPITKDVKASEVPKVTGKRKRAVAAITEIQSGPQTTSVVNGLQQSANPEVESSNANLEQIDKKQTKHERLLSKFDKSTRKAAALAAAQAEAETTDSLLVNEQTSERILHDLVPIPVPEREPTPEYVPFSTLPPWLRNPVMVAADARKSFSDIGVNPKTIARLRAKGLTEAFAVQSELIPRLMYHVDNKWARPNDICVSAPTGSGKTLAYALPITEALRREQYVRELRAIIIVPTRELVTQALATFRQCSGGSELVIQTATGTQTLAEEQAMLIRKCCRHDPTEYASLIAKIGKRQLFEDEAGPETGDIDSSESRLQQYYDDALALEECYVPVYQDNVDILICTPGRLVEHIENTVGFNLSNIKWLVIDEADRLLDQSFQDWVRILNRNLRKKPVLDEPQAESAYVQKIILSATMTRDINQLSSLNLRRPTMVVVKSKAGDSDDGRMHPSHSGVNSAYELPAGISETVIPVGDGVDKPLYLFQALRSIFSGQDIAKPKDPRNRVVSASSSEDSDSSDDSSDSDSDSSDSSDSGDSESSSSNESDSASSASSVPSMNATNQASLSKEIDDKSPQILVFASSTAEAHRVEYLLSALSDELLGSQLEILLLTRTRSGINSSPSNGKPRIIVSTDRASRGLDLPLTHVINYTIPRTLESYVHRVGRTARAGRTGHAHSLVRDVEARWFWNEIAKSSKVNRPADVRRIKVALDPEWKTGAKKEKYQSVLAEMGKMVEQAE